MSIAERWRRHPPLPPDILARIERLPDLFRERPVRLAYLFGSATAGARPDDVDIAILMRKGSPLDLAADVAHVLGTDRVDLVDLAHAPPLLKFQVVKEERRNRR